MLATLSPPVAGGELKGGYSLSPPVAGGELKGGLSPGFEETGLRVVTMHILRTVTLRHIIVTPQTPTHSRFSALCDDVTQNYAPYTVKRPV